MAVIVANRDKPKDCAHCWNHFDCDRYDDYCAKTVEGFTHYDCPLKELDAKAIIEEIKDHAVEFELFGLSDDYISIGILKDIINKHLQEVANE